MLAFINLLGFFSLSACLSLRWDRPLDKVLPIATALWLLILYVLAFFRGLFLIDVVSVLCILLAGLLYFRRFGNGAFRELAGTLFAPRSIALYTVMLIAFILMKDLLIRSADDLHCWALEVKSIDHFKGFAPQFLHASVDYGNYSPATTLFRWWCVHMLPEFTEGMIAVGSAWMFVLILAPLFSCINYGLFLAPFAGLCSAGLLLLLPGTLDSICYQSLCAELPIAAALALCLISGLSESFAKHSGMVSQSSRLPYAHALYLSCFMLMNFCKQSGIAFAVSVFVLLLCIKKHEPAGGRHTLLSLVSRHSLLHCFLISLLPIVSWTIFCMVTSRSAYFSFSLPETAAAGAGLSALWENYGAGYLSSLFNAFFLFPIHSGGAVIKLSVFMYLVLVALFLLAAVRLGIFGKKTGAALAKYVLIMAAAIFVSLYVMHCFVFQESQYFAPETMVLSITHYGQPFLLGWLIFMFYMLIAESHGKLRLFFIALLAFFTLSCSCLYMIYYRLVSYEQGSIQALQSRQASLEYFDDFLTCRSAAAAQCSRYLLVYQPGALSYFPQIPIQFLCAPDSLILYEYDPAIHSAESCAAELQSIVQLHRPDYVFLMDLDPGLLQALDPNAQNGIMYPLE